jgi:hypothetical protein
VARSKYLKENLIKLDGSLATDDEFDRTVDDDAQLQAQQISVSQSQTSIQSKQTTNVSKQSKPKQSEDIGSKQSKGSKLKKETSDTKIASADITEQVTEPVLVEEVFSNRPPTPPKPKTQLPPLDLSPFIRLEPHFEFLKRLKNQNFKKYIFYSIFRKIK